MSQTDVKKQENHRPGPGGGGGPRTAAAHGKIRIDRNSVKLFVRLMSFMRGKQLAQFIEQEYLKMGCEGTSFPPIVSFGANAADPRRWSINLLPI